MMYFESALIALPLVLFFIASSFQRTEAAVKLIYRGAFLILFGFLSYTLLLNLGFHQLTLVEEKTLLIGSDVINLASCIVVLCLYIAVHKFTLAVYEEFEANDID
ncbi:hypothetical protein G3U99_25895 (plasmid) [Vibrio coralliilyticus OCN008]|uniref:hypothetical protein n=1 Tax=Vibrio coralliilyticus TaxID=190893 RepID=UPI0003911622|nr:hypothetical protein [Vibrio coralliilyticus]ERB62559.1 hypothetical protein N779_25660 [Vibrio coralliilyticus OCN008]QIJ87715.1 hypothetical protein G3U99_25895 [Vibrio coralliilyticus OCN008]